MPQGTWNEMMRQEIVKREGDLMANIKVKNESIRDVYSQSAIYFEKKRKGRNSMQTQPHKIH
jgi:hypothetical protein